MRANETKEMPLCSALGALDGFIRPGWRLQQLPPDAFSPALKFVLESLQMCAEIVKAVRDDQQ